MFAFDCLPATFYTMYPMTEGGCCPRRAQTVFLFLQSPPDDARKIKMALSVLVRFMHLLFVVLMAGALKPAASSCGVTLPCGCSVAWGVGTDMHVAHYADDPKVLELDRTHKL